MKRVHLFTLSLLLTLGGATALLQAAVPDSAPAGAPPPTAPDRGPRPFLERPEHPFRGPHLPGRPPFRQRRQQRELVRVFDDVVLERNASVPNLVAVFGDALIEGEVRGDAVVVMGSAKVSGPVNGNLVVVMGEAELTDTARINGDVVLVGGTLNAAPGAEIRGSRFELKLANLGHRVSLWFRSGLFMMRPLPPGVGLAWSILALHLLIYFLLTLLLPRPVAASARELRLRPGPCFLVGLLSLILCVPLVLILAATGVGLLLLPLLLLLLTGAVFLGKTATLQFIGGQTMNRFRAGAQPGTLLALFLGAAVVTLVYLIPILGLVTWGVLLPLSLGAVLLALAQSFQQQGTGSSAMTSPAPFATLNPSAPSPIHATDPDATSTSSMDGLATPSTATSNATPPTPRSTEPADQEAAGTPPKEKPPQQAAPTDWTPGACCPCPVAATVASFSPAELAVMPRAGFWLRFAATLLDFILLIWVLPVAERWFAPIWVAYHVALWTWKGTTIGGIVCGLKVVRPDGRPVDFTVALVRSLASVFSLAALGLGFFWVGWTKERLAWHDRIAGTTIVRLPKGVSLI